MSTLAGSKKGSCSLQRTVGRNTGGLVEQQDTIDPTIDAPGLQRPGSQSGKNSVLTGVIGKSAVITFFEISGCAVLCDRLVYQLR